MRPRNDNAEPEPKFAPPRYIPPAEPPRPAELNPTEREFRGLKLYPFQAAAVDAIAAGHSVIVAAPTGAGKTLVADYAIDAAFAAGRRVVYTSPVKALSNQKFRDFRARHGDQVGIMTGDVVIRGDAPLLVMTTEVFRNTLFDEPERLATFQFVIHDEVHYLDDRERGTVWEESIIHAPETMRLVCLSATIPNVGELADWIASVRGEEVTVVEMARRPVPLDHLTWLPDNGPVPVEQACTILDQPLRLRSRMRRERSPARLLDWLERERLLPLLYFCFSRKACETHALENAKRTLLSPADGDLMEEMVNDLFRRYEMEKSVESERLRSMALAGVAYHHAGMLPIHKEIVERLFTSGLVKMLFATETFALGVNMPARAVAFDSLRKFDGERMDYMLCREYGQMAGRAGRQGIDTHGLVISRVDPAMDRSRGVKRVLTGPPESVESRFDPNYSTILSLYEHMGDRVVETYEKSFAKFQRARRRGANTGRSAEERILGTRLELLKSHGYTAREGGLSDKGRFASHVNGYEIQATEWRAAGLFDRLDARRIGAVLLAASYEPRVDETVAPPKDRDLAAIRREAIDIVGAWRDAEWHAGLAQLVQEPHFGMSAVLEKWIDGEALARCRELTSTSEGEIVRRFRQLLQYAKQIERAIGDDEFVLRAKLKELRRMVDRDEVDARRQLELGQDPLAVEDPDGIITSSDADLDEAHVPPGVAIHHHRPEHVAPKPPTVEPVRDDAHPAVHHRPKHGKSATREAAARPQPPADDDFGEGIE
ncbi:MAG: DEAD/DEAH box helicase [Planctomycetes bacterium]|nr:DEAD/DEAH box helicase [Planctomycetota bacterium]